MQYLVKDTETKGLISMNLAATPLLVAILAGPMATGLVTAIGIIAERRRTAKDIESRRGKLIDFAHSQLTAVQILDSIKGASEANTSENMKKEDSIISAALDALLQAQEMKSPPTRDKHKDILTDLLLIGRVETRGGKLLRTLYHLGFVWTGFFVIMMISQISLAASTSVYSDIFMWIFIFLVLGVAPVAGMRQAAIGYDFHAKSKALKKNATRQPPHGFPPYQPPPFSQQHPLYPPAGMYQQRPTGGGPQ